MSPAQATPPAEIILPPSVISKEDFARLLNELEAIDGELTTNSIRQEVNGATQPTLTMSGRLADFLQQNNLTLTDAGERSRLIARMSAIKQKAPVVHMTFAVEADQESLRLLVQWVRVAVHPQAVIRVGLQPSLVAGVYVRTTNNVIDLSLRKALKNARGVLAKDLGALRGRV